MRWHGCARDAKGRLEGMSGLFGNRIDERWQLWALRRSRLAICPGTWPLTAYWSSLPIDGGKRRAFAMDLYVYGVYQALTYRIGDKLQ
jgi:hypothetical protein